MIIKSGNAPSEFQGGDTPYLKVDDMNNSTIFQKSTKHNVAGDNNKIVSNGAIVFAKRGAAILTNKVRILATEMFMDTNMMALIPVRIDLLFLYFFLSKENLSKIADTSTIPQINNKHVAPYQVSTPEFKEQEKIGILLMTTSSLIAANEQDQKQTFKIAKNISSLMLMIV
ncbi:restriction endonuclease subunit S [Lactiplantibacillus pentosus]|nr:restriction endonuclease subunit S [Lactiplantibacillus pentosus]